MNWLSVAWSICAGFCFMLSLLHLWLWIKDRNRNSYILSTIMAMSAGAGALTELALMHAQSTLAYAELLQLEVTFVYLLLVSMVWLVLVQLGSYQRWLAYVIIIIWSIALIANFVSPGSLVYEQVDKLNRSMTFWGEHYSVGSGRANPWNQLANIGVLLIIIYVIMVARKAWQRGEQRRAVTLGGSIVLFMLLAGTHSMLVDNGIIDTPYMVSFAYLAIVLAMSYELVNQAIQVPLLTRELATNQQRWQNLLDNVQLAVIAIDPAGRITYANPFLQKLTGYPESELIQQPAEMLIPVTGQKETKHLLQQALEQGPRPHSQSRILCTTGEERYLAWSSVRQFDADGRVAGLVSVGADVTEQLSAQRDLQHTQQEMERMMRANILGELASAMAHELNQPLAAILSNAQAARRMLAANKLDSTVLDEILEDIVRDDKRAGEVIHGLRALFRRGEISRESFAVDNMIAEVARMLKSELEAEAIQLELDIAPNLPQLYANKVEIQQVIMNLLINAIRIQSEVTADQRSINIQAAADDKMMTLKVRDHGPGIQGVAMEKVFEPFYTTHREGLGMGLALSRRIVQAHGGQIQVENHAEGGAEFSFTVPLTNK